jgi:hypothetical protein
VEGEALWYRFLDWLKTACGIYTRYGLNANNGTIEYLGFVTERHAQQWALRNKLQDWVTFEYDTRERLLPALHRSTSSYPAPRNSERP